MNVLVPLAHNDDEYFASLHIINEVKLGNRVLVAYLTHGSLYGADSETRIAESTRVLIRLGIHPEDIFLLGYENDIFDGRLSERIVDGYEILCSRISEELHIDRMYVMAWEGGHPDHDACHMIGVAYAHTINLRQQLYEFPAYHAVRNRLKSSGVMQFMNSNLDTFSTAPSRVNAFHAFCLAFSYKSQLSTFLALLPGSVTQLLLRGYQVCRKVPEDRDYTQPPHNGTLLYERRFRLSFSSFAKNTQAIYKYL